MSCIQFVYHFQNLEESNHARTDLYYFVAEQTIDRGGRIHSCEPN